MSKISSIYNTVLILLRENEKYRDDDLSLCARIWWEESEGVNDKMGFLASYVSGKITQADAITRARRKAQEKYPSLRGTKKEVRNKKQEEVMEELRKL